ncbi:hypothetical protein [Paludisphaera sp.]|uniref:hypothetical protein n=1 Tax=Paludisphaera sp. TaxID=2017432 RepID=UPI00301DF943
MMRPGWVIAFGIVAAWGVVAPSRAEASAYYTPTYVGTPGEVGNVPIADGMVSNQATGTSHAFLQSTRDRLGSLPSGYFDGLPTNQVRQGATRPVLNTYTMRPVAVNGSGIVLGTIPIHASSDPWRNPALGYAVKQADGGFSPFRQLAFHGEYYEFPQLSESGQILINRAGSGGMGGGSMLHDVATGVETAIRDLIPPELLARYGNSVYALGIDDRGDLLVHLSGAEPSGGGVLILTPPGLDAPAAVPEPSGAWLAAAAIAGLAFRARRRRDG